MIGRGRAKKNHFILVTKTDGKENLPTPTTMAQEESVIWWKMTVRNYYDNEILNWLKSALCVCVVWMWCTNTITTSNNKHNNSSSIFIHDEETSFGFHVPGQLNIYWDVRSLFHSLLLLPRRCWQFLFVVVVVNSIQSVNTKLSLECQFISLLLGSLLSWKICFLSIYRQQQQQQQA